MRLLLSRNIGLPARVGVYDDESEEMVTASLAWRRGQTVGVRIQQLSFAPIEPRATRRAHAVSFLRHPGLIRKRARTPNRLGHLGEGPKASRRCAAGGTGASRDTTANPGARAASAIPRSSSAPPPPAGRRAGGVGDGGVAGHDQIEACVIVAAVSRKRRFPASKSAGRRGRRKRGSPPDFSAPEPCNESGRAGTAAAAGLQRERARDVGLRIGVALPDAADAQSSPIAAPSGGRRAPAVDGDGTGTLSRRVAEGRGRLERDVGIKFPSRAALESGRRPRPSSRCNFRGQRKFGSAPAHHQREIARELDVSPRPWSFSTSTRCGGALRAFPGG